MSAWAVVNTLPHQESRAEANLVRQGFHVLLPSILRSRRHARRFDVVRAPLFPGYLFVDLGKAAGHWMRINGTFGVRRLLTRGERPQFLPAGFVESLQEGIGGDGVCHLPPENPRPGSRVRIVAGPFAECLATVAGMAPGERIRLLLSVLGGEVAVTVAGKAVVSAA